MLLLINSKPQKQWTNFLLGTDQMRVVVGTMNFALDTSNGIRFCHKLTLYLQECVAFTQQWWNTPEARDCLKDRLSKLPYGTLHSPPLIDPLISLSFRWLEAMHKAAHPIRQVRLSPQPFSQLPVCVSLQKGARQMLWCPVWGILDVFQMRMVSAQIQEWGFQFCCSFYFLKFVWHPSQEDTGRSHTVECSFPESLAVVHRGDKGTRPFLFTLKISRLPWAAAAVWAACVLHSDTQAGATLISVLVSRLSLFLHIHDPQL